MSPGLVFFIIASYFLLLIILARLTAGKGDSDSFFTANKNSPWYLVAFGMIGASLSGVTFISVPGWVGSSNFSYMQIVLGYLVGYFVIANVLLSIYYKLNLTSIYTYLESRFGFFSYKSGAAFFLLSRTIGAAFRLYLVAMVLQISLFDAWEVPFMATVAITILLIWVYTYRGGIKTIVWTDTLQTLFMLIAVFVSIYVISNDLNIDLTSLPGFIADQEMSRIFEWDWNSSQNFFKQFFAGTFIAIAMTGLDQDMMQKNLTCRNLKDAKKNMYWFSSSLVFVNLLFLILGLLLYNYTDFHSISLPERSDDLFPFLAVHHFPTYAGIIFLLGMTAAAYSSADSALTSLTTSFCVDFLNFKKIDDEKQKRKIRLKTHLGFSVLLFMVIVVFRILNDDTVISAIFKVAGYTYGPILGLFTFGIFTRYSIKDKYVPIVVLISPAISYFLDHMLPIWFEGFSLGFTVLIINGAFTFLGLLLLKNRRP
ncbi:sodium:solute symporter [Hyphobacterium sp. CCMP332]|nr:sodium:solute symporter [Hyphobacterium sp. CCMP332]